MAKKYTTFIHDYFEENPQISPAIQEQLLKKLNPKWFINKIRNQANN